MTPKNKDSEELGISLIESSIQIMGTAINVLFPKDTVLRTAHLKLLEARVMATEALTQIRKDGENNQSGN